MTTADAPHELWEGDVNETAIEGWKADTTTFDRVRHVCVVVTHRRLLRFARGMLTRWLASIVAVVGFNRPPPTIELIKREHVRRSTVLLMKRVSAGDTEHTPDKIPVAPASECAPH